MSLDRGDSVARWRCWRRVSITDDGQRDMCDGAEAVIRILAVERDRRSIPDHVTLMPPKDEAHMSASKLLNHHEISIRE